MSRSTRSESTVMAPIPQLVRPAPYKPHICTAKSLRDPESKPYNNSYSYPNRNLVGPLSSPYSSPCSNVYGNPYSNPHSNACNYTPHASRPRGGPQCTHPAGCSQPDGWHRGPHGCRLMCNIGVGKYRLRCNIRIEDFCH